MDFLNDEEYLKKYRKKSLFEYSETGIKYEGAITELLPQRPPFLFIDSIKQYDPLKKEIIGSRHIAVDDPVFAGHFPGMPIYPGVLHIEMIGQLAICFYTLLQKGQGINGLPNVRVTRANGALFMKEILPGDQIEILAKVIYEDTYKFKGIGQLLKGTEVCTVAIGEFMIL